MQQWPSIRCWPKNSVVCQQIPSGHADRGGVSSGVGEGQGFVGNEKVINASKAILSNI
jgi:hypothetical protein